jgi:hypothetical protein
LYLHFNTSFSRTCHLETTVHILANVTSSPSYMLHCL